MSTTPPIDTRLADRYVMLHQLGEGGMARVYEAHDELLDRRVAVKVLRERFATDAAFAERFWREARAAAGLSHPNIVQVYDCGREGDAGACYIVMELIDGPSLKALAQKEGPMGTERATALLEPVARALGHAHERGMVHRDVKPQNMLLDSHGALRMADFGIARTVDAGDTLTEAGAIIGTAQYLSPEQARGERATPASDVYCLGVVLYELVTGAAPFAGGTAVEVALRQVQDAPVPPSVMAPGVSPRLEAVIMRALEKAPERRYRDGNDFAAALRGEEVAATQAMPTVVMPVAAPVGAAPVAATPRRPARRLVPLLAVLALLAAVATVIAVTRGDDEAPNATPEQTATRPEPTAARDEPVAPPSEPAADPTAPVPNVVGASLDEARAMLEPLQLELVVGTAASDDFVPADAIVAQDPPVGTALAAGGQVVVTLSTGPSEERGQGKPKKDKPGKGNGRGGDEGDDGDDGDGDD